MLKKWRDKQFAFIWIPIILCPFIFLVGIIMGRSLTSCTTERAILSDPDKLAKLVRERYVCNLPSDNRCGHEGDLFRTFERNGLHLLPVHFYSAIPEVSRLSIEDFKRPIVPDAARSICEEDPISDKCPILQPVGINLNIPMQLIVVDSCKPFQNEMAQIPSVPLKVNGEELFHSRWVCSQHTPPGKNCPPYGALDAQLYHCIIRTARPALVMEIGSGHSTYVALEALRLAMQESRPGVLSFVRCKKDCNSSSSRNLCRSWIPNSLRSGSKMATFCSLTPHTLSRPGAMWFISSQKYFPGSDLGCWFMCTTSAYLSRQHGIGPSRTTDSGLNSTSSTLCLQAATTGRFCIWALCGSIICQAGLLAPFLSQGPMAHSGCEDVADPDQFSAVLSDRVLISRRQRP